MNQESKKKKLYIKIFKKSICCRYEHLQQKLLILLRMSTSAF